MMTMMKLRIVTMLVLGSGEDASLDLDPDPT
jgi:hypothetical protein